MAKFRSKLKRHSNGKQWSKGHSSTSNPEKMKHRLKANRRFFQQNLSLAPTENDQSENAITLEAISRHDQKYAFNAENMTINDIASSMKSVALADTYENDDDEIMSQSQTNTIKTCKTFASAYSACTNMDFKKLLVGFKASSELHKEMLAILTALTEIIKERGGKESSTEYFILLMEQIETSKENNEIIAGISLLAMGIKSVPPAVLRKRFDETGQTLLRCLQRFLEINNSNVIKYVILCLSTLLRAQEYVIWTYSSIRPYLDTLLTLSIHTKPKIRKAAQHAIIANINGASFILQQYPLINDTNSEKSEEIKSATNTNNSKIKYHPASERITNFCLSQFHSENLVNNQTTVLHTLTLLKDVTIGLKGENIRSICESLLSMMTAANTLVRVNCLQVFHSLFVSRTQNLSAIICAKLLSALHEYRPNASDIKQILPWLVVMKEGHIHLAALDRNLCLNALPYMVEICIDNLWQSDNLDIIANVCNFLKDIFNESIKVVCENDAVMQEHRISITRIINLLSKLLDQPFVHTTKYVIYLFGVIFEICGRSFQTELSNSLINLCQRYDTQSSLRVQIEHALIAAIKAVGPEGVLKIVPLADKKGDILLDKSWLLPLLREGTTGATFQFFREAILPLALDCNKKWHKHAEGNNKVLAHTYELLCCQLWGLFPGFCKIPKDPENLHALAPTLGNALENNIEFRAPIYDGLLELMQNTEQTEIRNALSKYAKNFLPRLFNIYTQKANGTYEQDLRKKSLEVVKMYLTIVTNSTLLKELFEFSLKQLYAAEVGTFHYDAVFDITATLLAYQECDVIKAFFETYMEPILMKNEISKLVAKDEEKLKKQQRKIYELLSEILSSTVVSCQTFLKENLPAIQDLLMEAFVTSCGACQGARLRCLKILIENQIDNKSNDKLITKCLPEVIIMYKQISIGKKDNISEEIFQQIADIYHNKSKLNDLVDIMTAGFAADESLITNTIWAFRTLLQIHGKDLTVSTLEFIMEQVLVFLVQKSRSQSMAAVAFIITFIKILPSPLIFKHLETLMKSLSAMTKDTKRFCRIQIGYLLRKLCKAFAIDDLLKFVPSHDEITQRRLRKIRKQINRENRKSQYDDAAKDSDDSESNDPINLLNGLEKKSVTIDDILADSDSDLIDDDIDERTDKTAVHAKRKSKNHSATVIREDPEDVIDLIDVKSIGNVLSASDNKYPTSNLQNKLKPKDPNRGFKLTPDGKLILSDKALAGCTGSDDDSDSDSTNSGAKESNQNNMSSADKILKPKLYSNKGLKRDLPADSSDDETSLYIKPKRVISDAKSMRSAKTSSTSKYSTVSKGIHRTLNTQNNNKVQHSGKEYSTKKAKGDMKKKGKLDPYAYIPLSRNSLNKRRRAKYGSSFKNIMKKGKKSELKGVKNKIMKTKRK